jgi:hypothetical protein
MTTAGLQDCERCSPTIGQTRISGYSSSATGPSCPFAGSAAAQVFAHRSQIASTDSDMASQFAINARDAARTD